MPKWGISWSILILDVLAGWVAFLMVFKPILESGEIPLTLQLWIFVGIQFTWSVLFWLNNLYKGEPTISRFIEIQTFVQITFTVIVLLIFVDAIGLAKLHFSAPKIFRYWIVFGFIATVSRWMVRSVQKYFLSRGIGRLNTLILGINPRGIQAAEQLESHHQQGYEVVGFVKADDDPREPDSLPYPILGAENDLKSLIVDHQVADVVIALDHSDHNRIMSVVSHINGIPISIKIVPDLYEVINGLARTEQLYGLPLIQINPNLNTWYQNGFKRFMDLLITVPVLVVLSPVWLILAGVIKLNSPGPVLYKQLRIGKGNEQFNIYKFRSMVQDAEKWTGPVWARDEDTRITRVGRFLRRFRLDEIPQFINVVKGEMSLIGPRPERPYFVDKLTQEYPFYHRRNLIRPGITGWAQIKHPYDRDIDDVRQKLKYDFFYIENLSLNLDMKILLSTAWVMLSGRGR